MTSQRYRVVPSTSSDLGGSLPAASQCLNNENHAPAGGDYPGRYFRGQRLQDNNVDNPEWIDIGPELVNYNKSFYRMDERELSPENYPVEYGDPGVGIAYGTEDVAMGDDEGSYDNNYEHDGALGSAGDVDLMDIVDDGHGSVGARVQHEVEEGYWKPPNVPYSMMYEEEQVDELDCNIGGFPAETMSPLMTTPYDETQNHNILQEYTAVDADEHIGFQSGQCLLPGCRKGHVFESIQSYRSHLKNVHGKSIFCPLQQCPHTKPFANKTDLKRHELAKHNTKIEKPFKCDRLDCSARVKAWGRKDKLKEHNRKYHSNFMCYFCSKDPRHQQWFESFSELAAHTTSNHGPTLWPMEGE